MTRNIFAATTLIAFAALLAACAPQGTKLSTPIKRVGIVVNSNSNEICYNYTGFTVFSNATHPYEFPSGFNQLAKSSLEKAFGAHNVETISIDPSRIRKNGPITQTSSWDGSQTILSSHLNATKEIATKEKLDAILVLDPQTTTSGDESCSGVANVNSTTYGIFLVTPAIGVFAANGEFSRNLYNNIKVTSAPLARHPKTLNEAYLKHLEVLYEGDLKKAVDNLLGGRR